MIEYYLSKNSISEKGDRDIHDKNSAREGMSKEIKYLQVGEALSMLMRRGQRHQKWMRMIHDPERGENTSRRRGFGR